MGFKYKGGMLITSQVPSREPTNVIGIRRFTKGHSTLPERAYAIAAVNAPNTLDNLLLPSATLGGKLVSNMAGTEINPPPPTMESTKPANAPAKITSAASKVPDQYNLHPYMPHFKRAKIVL